MGRSEDPGFCLLGSVMLLKQVTELETNAKAAREMDPEGVHQMRVASRRLRAALPIFGSCLKESQHGRWRDGVKGLTRALGEARDTDVQVEYLRSFLERTDGVERQGVSALLQLKEASRREQQEQVLGWLDNMNEEGVLREMSDVLSKKVKRLEARRLDVRGRPSFAAGLAHASYRVGKVLELEPFVADPQAIGKHHQMRIAIKRLRYTLETFRPLFDDQLKEEIDTLKGVQDILGEMHDCDVWLAGMDGIREQLRSSPDADIEALEPGLRAIGEDRAGERAKLYGKFAARWPQLREKRSFERLADRFQAGMAYKDLAIPMADAHRPARLAIVSDIHGNMDALKAVMAHAVSQSVGGFLNLGDMVGSGPYPEEVVSTIRGDHFLSVVGNFDLKVLEFTRASKRPKATSVRGAVIAAAARDLSEESLKFISSLPPEIRLEMLGRRVLMVHASPGDPDEHLTPDTPEERLAELGRIADADVVLVGHSHQAFARKVGDTLFVNPGSVGRPVDHDPRASYAILDTADFSVALHRVEYDVEATVKALREKGLPEEVADVIRGGRSAPKEREGKRSAPASRASAMEQLERTARRMNVDHQHAENVLRLAASLFRQLKPLHGLGGKDRFLLEAACLLHDAGITEGVKGHHRSSYRLIMEAELPLGPEDKRMVACMARFHRKRPPRDSDEEIAPFGEKDRQRLYALTSILRIADGLDYQHAGVVKEVDCTISDADVVVKISSDEDWTAEAEAAMRKADLFERTFGRKVRIE
jgi:putative phosphoesterase